MALVYPTRLGAGYRSGRFRPHALGKHNLDSRCADGSEYFAQLLANRGAYRPQRFQDGEYPISRPHLLELLACVIDKLFIGVGQLLDKFRNFAWTRFGACLRSQPNQGNKQSSTDQNTAISLNCVVRHVTTHFRRQQLNERKKATRVANARPAPRPSTRLPRRSLVIVQPVRRNLPMHSSRISKFFLLTPPIASSARRSE